jgi:hypothetical protein
MSKPVVCTKHAPSTCHLHAVFLAMLPRIQRHGRVYFRDVKNAERRDEFLAEMIALSWVWFVRLVRRGKDPANFVSAIATFAARAVRSGRRLCGQERAKDVLSARAQRQHGFTVNSMPEHQSMTSTDFAEALRDNTQSAPDEQAAFRHDFPLWLSRYGPRHRRIALDMALGHRTNDLSHFHGCSAARISQLRRDYHDDWQRFTGEDSATDARTGRRR